MARLNLAAHQNQMAIGSGGPSKSWDGARTRRVMFLERWLAKHGSGALTADKRTIVAQGLLREIWESASSYRGVTPLLLRSGGGHRANPRWWRARVLTAGDGVFRCTVCGRLHAESVGGICARYGCRGDLNHVDSASPGARDHYRVLYEQPLPPMLRAEEHTAQISRDKAREFQVDFEAGRIHLLSCSTTFELGIDLGDLDTIFLRNAPPEPFNYAQRVGRAGRRRNPGFAITYCRSRPHDQSAFEAPHGLMAGRTRPPDSQTLRTTRLLLGTLVAVALGAFFKENRGRFESQVEGLVSSKNQASRRVRWIALTKNKGRSTPVEALAHG